MPLTKSFLLLARISITSVALLASGSALARPEVPGELQEVANMQCVPLCTMCHSANPGTKANWDPAARPLALALNVPVLNELDIKPAYDAWAQMNPNLAALVVKGIEPGTRADVCGPTYGCSVPMVAKHPARPRDYTAVLWAVGAMVVGGILRRRRKTNAR